MASSSIQQAIDREARWVWGLWLLLAVVCTVPFWLTSLDIALARPYYVPSATPLLSWPLSKAGFWNFLYVSAPISSAGLGVAGLLAIIWGSAKDRRRHWRMFGSLVFISIALGPGLLVNMIFKANWGRPRPVQLAEFGGAARYTPPLQPGNGGKSFPCGHCSVGFVIGALALAFRKYHPRVAVGIFAYSILAGLLMGYGRMVAGGHFFSDVLWGGLLTWAGILLVYYHILRVPYRIEEPSRYPSLKFASGAVVRGWATMGTLLVVLLLGALSSTPYSQDLEGTVNPPTPNGALCLQMPDMDVEVVLVHEGPRVAYAGHLEGFGFPGRKVKVRENLEAAVRFMKTGLFTEMTGEVIIKVNATGLKNLTIAQRGGEVTIVNEKTFTNPPEITWELTKGSRRR